MHEERESMEYLVCSAAGHQGLATILVYKWLCRAHLFKIVGWIQGAMFLAHSSQHVLPIRARVQHILLNGVNMQHILLSVANEQIQVCIGSIEHCTEIAHWIHWAQSEQYLIWCDSRELLNKYLRDWTGQLR